jgi:hypothetical protein
MLNGVPPTYQSLSGDSLAVPRRPVLRAGRRTFRAGLLLVGSLSTLVFASSALGATATVGLGTAGSFSVLGGETVTNTGATTMFGDLGLSPGSAVTGSPHVLGATHVADAVALGAKNDLTTAYNSAAPPRPYDASAGSELAGRTFLPGVYNASSSLLLSSGSVTLDAQGNPNAVFIFQVGSTLITEANTSVQVINGAQACNVFWQVGSSATLGTGTRFVGTIMALTSISAKTAATVHGRLLARNGAVTMDTNTITTSNCPGGGTETTTAAEANTLAEAIALAQGITAGKAGPKAVTAPRAPIGSKSTGKRRHRARRHATRRVRHVTARRALPHSRGAFTG